MPEGLDNLVIEPPRHIRGVVDGLREDSRETRHRLSVLELGLAGVSTQ